MIRIAILALALMASPAFAQDWQQNFFGHSSTYRNPDEHRHHRHHAPRPIVIYRKPEVRSWVHVEEPNEHRGHDCRSILTVVGDQALSTDGAKKEAIKAWRQQVRFAHGERYTEPNYARGTTFACVKSSIGSVAGVTEERCEIRAAPCTTPRMEVER